MENEMQGPLYGVRVVDLTTVVSGPSATMILADQGADVIKIEAPRGDFARDVTTRRGGFSASFLNNNRNKRSVVLDLKSKVGIKAVRHLVRDADIFIHNFRPGVTERLGLNEEILREIKADLIYVSISGFGFDGPYKDKPVYDPLIQAVSSLTTVQAGSDEKRPKLIRTILPDKLTGIQASQAVTAALFARERTGKGQHIKLSMLDTIISFLWNSDMGAHTFIGDEFDAEQAQSFIDLVYETADGYVSVAVMQDKQWQSFCKAVGRDELLSDQRFLNAQDRENNKDERLQEIQDSIISYKSGEILQILEAADVPCAPVLTRTQMRQHPQVVANNIITEFEHPQAGLLRQSRHPASFSETPTSIRSGAPRLGEHTREVLEQSGFDEALLDEILSNNEN